MAVQQNKKSPSKRGMHRSHNAVTPARHRHRADHGRSAPAAPHQPHRLLSWPQGVEVEGRRLTRSGTRSQRQPVGHEHPCHSAQSCCTLRLRRAAALPLPRARFHACAAPVFTYRSASSRRRGLPSLTQAGAASRPFRDAPFRPRTPCRGLHRSGLHGWRPWPAVTLPACKAFLDSHAQAQCCSSARPMHWRPRANWERCRIVDASEVVTMDDPIEVALRRKKNSSMRVAISQLVGIDGAPCRWRMPASRPATPAR